MKRTLLMITALSLSACGGGGGGGSAVNPSVSSSGSGANISSVSFDLTGAVGLAITDLSNSSSGKSVKSVDSGSSNLKKVNTDNSLGDAVKSGYVSVQDFMIAANNNIYLLLSSPVESCILIRVEGTDSQTTTKTTCIDSTLTTISWNNKFNDPIQFDGAGNIYYAGTDNQGHVVLRENSNGTVTDLINDNISLAGFLVLYDGSVLIAGETRSTTTKWTRIITPAHSIKNIIDIDARFMSIFPDNNAYLGVPYFGSQDVDRYLSATNTLDTLGWIGAKNSYQACPGEGYGACSADVRSIFKTSDGKVFFVSGNLVQAYPQVSLINTSVSKITVSKGILTNIILGGLDNNSTNKLVLYDTSNGTESNLLGDNNIEAYHVNLLNSDNNQIVMFDGLRFSDNSYVLCQVNLTSNDTLNCSKSGTSKLTDFQLFNTTAIASGSTSATKTYTIGGTISGLHGALVVQNNSGAPLTITQNGPFTFPIAVESTYDVSIKTQPTGQTCVVSNGTGTISKSNITSVLINCTTTSGTIVTVAKDANAPGLASDSFGNLYFISNGGIKRIDKDGVITPFAGNMYGYSGDGGSAINANMSPYSLATDPSGNLYLSDDNNTRIRKVDKISGIITTIAGNGKTGYSGDGGAAINAGLIVNGIACDSAGNLYISDASSDRIRKIDANGIITTFAGTGIAGYSGDGGLAINAKFDRVVALAFDSSGNLFLSDSGNLVIRKIVPNGTITTIAGSGAQGFTGDGGLAINAELGNPHAIAIDPSGNVYFSDRQNGRVRMIDKTSGKISTVAGGGNDNPGDGGLATNADIAGAMGLRAVTLDSSGNLYITDGYSKLRMVGK